VKRDKEFNNILDECLEYILVEGETAEQCLKRYPDCATELEPLLKTAVATSEALAIQPDAEYKARARYHLRSVLEDVKPGKRAPILSWQPRWAMAMVVLLAVVVVGGGTVVAADNSMPDNPLYPVKLATEQVRVALTPSDIGKAELYATLVDRRVAEIASMVDKGKPQWVESVSQRLRMHLAKMNSLPLAEIAGEQVEGEPTEELVLPEKQEKGNTGAIRSVYVRTNRQAMFRNVLGRYATRHPEKLRSLLEKAPESAKPALQRAIEASVASYKKALEDID
jgi:hypothetical protein